MPRTVPPKGPTTAKIAFIGEAPGAKEEALGEPFIGPSGDLLTALLREAGINRQATYITNVVKERPLNNIIAKFITFDKKGNPTKSEAYLQYEQQLIDEIKALDANVLVPMGNVSLNALTGLHMISKWRGSILWSELVGKKVIPTYHPAASMYHRDEDVAGGEKQIKGYLIRHIILHDLRTKIKPQSEFPELRRPKRDYVLAPDFLTAKQYLHTLHTSGIMGMTISFDIETLNGEVSCISFSNAPTWSMSIPFYTSRGSFYSPDEEAELMERIAKLLEDKRVRKGGQNLAFDVSFLFYKYGISTKNYDDTMVAHKTYLPDYPIGLDFINSCYTEEPYYKDEGKAYSRILGTDEDFLLYNAKDSIVVSEIIPKLEKDLKEVNNHQTYLDQTKLIEPIIYMSQRGMRVDEEGLKKASEEMETEIDRVQDELNQEAGMTLNPNSPSQVKEYFYGRLGIKEYKYKGKVTTNEKALTRIAIKGYKEAQLIRQIRQMVKLNSTYYKMKLRNSRLHCSYMPVTKTGRLSSREDLFGYGTNMQNQPKKMNKYFLADPGYIIYNVDLSQADNRSVAYIAPEPRMIKAFEDGLDVHSLTAGLIFNLPYNEIIDMNEEDVKCPIGYGDQTHRYWGKGTNHKLNFGMGYKTFAYELEISEKEGRELWNSYHSVYPGVTQRFHRWVVAALDTDRSLTNCFGRRAFFLDRWGPELFNQAYAFIPQSNTADVINRRGLIPFYYDELYALVELLRQVHDSINFQIPISAGLAYHALVLRMMKAELERSIQWKNSHFTIPAEFSAGFNLLDQTKLNFSTDIKCQLQKLCVKNIPKFGHRIDGVPRYRG